MSYRYIPPVRDMMFVIADWLDAEANWREIPAWSDLDIKTVQQVLEEAARFVAERIAPLNTTGDVEGCRFEGGVVTMPSGFRESYRAYVDGGWPSIAVDETLDGQNLPGLLEVALHEMLAAANHAWLMSPGLSHGALACLQAHGPDEVKRDYLPKIASGEWLATMCLTEPQAGTDLGQVRTRATPAPDGGYLITGGKIFISGGDHDLTDNIVHLVLARLPDAPSGTRGLSLFLVPKWLSRNGSQQLRNGVHCDGMEKKLGLKASPTCTMRFERARGFLVGEVNRGLGAMFVMMNAARLQVAMQGVGHAESSWQRARAYAEERVQGRAVSPRSSGLFDDAGPVPIIIHPAMRRRLFDLRCMAEASRTIGYWIGGWIDRASHHPDVAERARSEGLASLLTPIAKAFFTATGFASASSALQVFGGYGYIHEYGIEQTLRDSRVAMLYEGTNEAQAIDLVVRKVIDDKARNVKLLLSLIHEECEIVLSMDSTGKWIAGIVANMCGQTRQITDTLIERSDGDRELAYRVADYYLSMFGWLLLAYAWARTWRIASAKPKDRFYEEKCVTSLYFFEHRADDFDHWRRKVETGFGKQLPFLA